jgi:hypothetical protein
VSGALTIEDAEISGAPPNADVSTAGEMPAAPLLDVSVTLGRSVRVATPNLRTEVVGSLRVTGSPREPFAAGLFETRSGSVRFPGANARILNGRIEVSLRRDPETRQLRPIVTLDVAARGQVGNDAITVAVRGPVDLSADPRSALPPWASAAGRTRATCVSTSLVARPEPGRGVRAPLRHRATLGLGQLDQRRRLRAGCRLAFVRSAVLGLERSLEQILGLGLADAGVPVQRAVRHPDRQGDRRPRVRDVPPHHRRLAHGRQWRAARLRPRPATRCASSTA